MRRLDQVGAWFFLTAIAVFSMSAAAQVPQMAAVQATQPIIDFASDSQVRALVAQAKASLKTGQAMASALPLVRVPGYRAVVEYRVAPTPPMSHDHDAEFMYVVDGSGTLVMGGSLVDPKRPNDANVVGTSIVGGEPHPLAPGSVIFVPRAVPHHFAQIGPNGLSVVTMHIPGAP